MEVPLPQVQDQGRKLWHPGGALYRITNATLGTLIGITVPVTSGPRIDGARDNQVVVGRSNLQRIFDLNVVFLDFGPTLGVGEQDGF